MTSPQRSASNTALGVAVLRAVHQLLDGEPKILRDDAILKLLGPELLEKARNNPERIQSATGRALRSHVVLRSRFAEDCLAAAVERGTGQYVILGAGFDTFAYRQPEWSHALRIFEVDHAASQRAKIERLREADIAIPPNLQFVAADFATMSLREILQASPFHFSEPAFFSCLGVLVYLEEKDVEAIFHLVSSLPKSSELVFTFSSADNDPGGVAAALAAGAAAFGEPWRTYHEPEALQKQLGEMGFSEVSILSPEEAEQRYFGGRSDGLPVPKRASIARAIV